MCLTFQGGKNTFFKKCPNNGLVSEKNALFFIHDRGGGSSNRDSLNLSILDTGILILVHQARLITFSLNMVDYSMSFLSLSN